MAWVKPITALTLAEQSWASNDGDTLPHGCVVLIPDGTSTFGFSVRSVPVNAGKVLNCEDNA